MQLKRFVKCASIFRRMLSMYSDFQRVWGHNMKVIWSVHFPVTPGIFFSLLFFGFLGKTSSLILALSFCITAQTANRILEEECLVASFFWLITGRTKCASPLTISQKWNFKEFAGIQQPTVHSSVIWYSFKSGSQLHTKNSPALIFLLCKHQLRTHTSGKKLQFSYLPRQCLTG